MKRTKDKKDKNKMRGKPSEIVISFICFLFLCFVFVSLFYYNFFNKALKHFLLDSFSLVCADNSLKVHFINVGQAECIVINLPNGEVAVIDAGENDNFSKNAIINYIDNKVMYYKYDKVIDHFIITHSHSDHVGGTSALLKNYEVKNIYRPYIYSNIENADTTGKVVVDTLVYADAIKAIYDEVENGARMHFVHNGLQIKSGKSSFTFYGYMTYPKASEINNFSPVIKLEYDDFSFVFTGDIESKSEREILNYYEDELDADIYNVAHHGSKTSNCLEFLQAVSPEYAVISVGLNNNYYHPDLETLQNLKQAGVQENKILRTDKDGNILFITGGGYKFAKKSGEYYGVFNAEWWMCCAVIVFANGVVLFAVFKSSKKSKLT